MYLPRRASVMLLLGLLWLRKLGLQLCWLKVLVAGPVSSLWTVDCRRMNCGLRLEVPSVLTFPLRIYTVSRILGMWLACIFLESVTRRNAAPMIMVVGMRFRGRVLSVIRSQRCSNGRLRRG